MIAFVCFGFLAVEGIAALTGDDEGQPSRSEPASLDEPAFDMPENDDTGFDPPDLDYYPHEDDWVGGDLDCGDIGHRVEVPGPDPHNLDDDNDGIGCEAWG